MTTHIFIVDTKTFKIHLEYLFVGTGAGDKNVDFNNRSKTELHHKTENGLVQMIADGSRIRSGDQIIFYLQQNATKGIHDGKFFGIFTAKTDGCFLDNNDSQQYLTTVLEKSLTFRTLIEPANVYADGVTEWEALDEIKNISSPNHMLWSLIYRKLKGNRGNTMITISEAERLTKLIVNKNNEEELNCNNQILSFDENTQKIISLNETPNSYTGRQEVINILPRLVAKYQQGKAFEAHLQAYILGNLGMGRNRSLDDSLIEGAKIEWIGNEVSCGVGMQRIDIMVSMTKNEQRVLIPVELKAVEALEDNMVQLTRYINWIEQYYIPNYPSEVQPALLTQKMEDKETQKYQSLVESFNTFNSENSSRCLRLQYIEFTVTEDELVFESVSY